MKKGREKTRLIAPLSLLRKDLTNLSRPIQSRGFVSFYLYSTTIAAHYKGRKRFQKRTEPKHKVGTRIRAREVRLVDPEGEMLGVVSIEEALEKAQAAGLELVEISPKAKPPVCKIIDYGKFLYEEKKKEKIQKKASKGHEMKGIRLSFRIGPGDLERQRKHAEEFLSTGHPVRIQLIMRGREKAHKNLAFDKLKEFVASLEAFGVQEQTPRLSGYQIVSVLKPKPKGK